MWALHPFGLSPKKCLVYCPQPDLLKHKNKQNYLKLKTKKTNETKKKTKTKQERKENKSVMAG